MKNSEHANVPSCELDSSLRAKPRRWLLLGIGACLFHVAYLLQFEHLWYHHTCDWMPRVPGAIGIIVWNAQRDLPALLVFLSTGLYYGRTGGWQEVKMPMLFVGIVSGFLKVVATKDDEIITESLSASLAFDSKLLMPLAFVVLGIAIVKARNLRLFALKSAQGDRSNLIASRLVFLWSLAIGHWSFLGAADIPPDQLDFFEKRIRPILVNNCYKCHSTSADRAKGGLHVDTRQALVTGGDTGPAIKPGDPASSLMIKAMKYTDPDLQMPPDDKKLPDYVIRDFEQWIRLGAPDPRGLDGKKVFAKPKSPKDHWSFQPVFKPIIPDSNKEWIPKEQNEIDRFVFQKLWQKGLSPSPKADKITLIRRATFNLTGLPPTLEEVDAFLADTKANAFEAVIDRLLLSTRYGERWGRYWLDVARYGDTMGGNGRRNQRFFHSWTYRDWVIRAFNMDMPYTEFILLQIAADRLVTADQNAHLSAMGFLTLGNRFDNQTDDIIDDRIDVVAKGFLGLTVTCARCHDHKFDPIPTADYYSLHGIFRSSREPDDAPMMPVNTNSAVYQEYLVEIARKEAEVEQFDIKLRFSLKQGAVAQTADYLTAIYEFSQPGNTNSFKKIVEDKKLSLDIANVWKGALEKFEKTPNPVFQPYIEYAKLPAAQFRVEAIKVYQEHKTNAAKKAQMNPRVMRMFASAPWNMQQIITNYATLISAADRQWQTEYYNWSQRGQSVQPTPPAPTTLSDTSLEEVRKVIYDPTSPAYLMDNKRWEQMANGLLRRNRNLRREKENLVQEADTLKRTHPGAAPRAVILVDNDSGNDSRIYVKGDRRQPGEIAPRRFLEILSPKDRPTFSDGSGRLELARSIATQDNPLTARVMVNRIWLGQFGQGIVRSPNDFGTRCEGPSHPELLDYLAWTFMENGWSVKKMQKQIMMSWTWQQSSDDDARKSQIDPDNLWLWQMNRRRLDFEALRDTILHIGGTLDLRMGGQPVQLDSVPFSTRRSVYGLIDRRNVPDMLKAFDFPDPDATSGQRDFTIVPQQALFMMNSPLVINQAINTVQRGDLKALPTDGERVNMLYRLIYSRPPNEVEMRLALLYLASEWSAPKGPIAGAPPWEYGIGYLSRAGKVAQFFPILYSPRARIWQAGRQLPDNRFGRAHLSAQGGHAPAGYTQTIVRRWTAPDDMLVSIEGNLSHSGNTGDGVRGRILYSAFGMIKTGNARQSQANMAVPLLRVAAGETVDFVVDCITNGNGDSFAWAPIIRKLDDKQNPPAPTGQVWNAQSQFRGPSGARRLYPWEKFAQVLLETNELTFIN